MKRFAFLVVLLLAVVLAAPAMGQTPKKGGALIFGRSGDSVGLDPAYETDGNSFMVCDNIYENLVFYKDESTEIEPGLAEKWDIAADGKTYTFHLRKGVKFHDGTDFDANAVVFSLGRMMKERNVKWFGKGYEIPAQERPAEYWVSMEMDNTIASIEAVDQYTVVFKLKRVEAPLLANMGMDFCSIISPAAFLKNPKEFIRTPVGTGPFKFVKWVKDDSITLERNPDYWDKKAGPYLDKVVFRSIPENSVRFLELKAGNIHICQFPNAADIDLAKKDASLKLVSQPGMNIGYLGYNHTKKVWQNIHMRKVVAYAINRKAIVDNIYQGMGEVAKNPIPPFMMGYNDKIQGYTYNLDEAKKEAELALKDLPGIVAALKEDIAKAEADLPAKQKAVDATADENAKKKAQADLDAANKALTKMKAEQSWLGDGSAIPELTLWSMPVARPYNPEGLKVGIAMIGDLAKSGINARIVSYDWGTYLKRQREQPVDMDMFQLGWTGDNGDPDNFLAVLFDGLASTSNRIQWKNETYHKMMQDGRQTVDPAKRAEIYKAACQLLFDEVPVIPVAHSMQIWPLMKNVMNYKLHPTASVYIKNVWLE
jgi:peptide/nickel transport system substrate-binding protein